MAKKTKSSPVKSPWAITPDEILPRVYPSGVVQDNVGKAVNHTIPDWIPATTQQPSPVVPEMTQSHPGISYADELANKKPNFTLGNNYDVPAVIEKAKPSHPGVAYADDIGRSMYEPNFVMQGKQYALPAPEMTSVVDDAANSMAKLTPWAQMKKAAAPVMKVGNAMANSSAGKLMLHPVTGAVMMAAESEDANAGEDNDVMRERRNMGLASDAPVQPFNPEAMENTQRVLAGIPAHDDQPNFNIPTEGNNQSPQMMTPPPQQPVMAKAQAPVNPEAQGRSVASQRGGFMNANMQYPAQLPPEQTDEYAEMIKRQQAGFNNKLASSSEFGYLNLAPAMQWVDGMTGSNLAKGYQAPPNAEHDMAKVGGLGKQLSDYQMDKEKNKIAMLNALKQQNKTNPYDLAKFKHDLAMSRLGAKGTKPLDLKQATDIKIKFSKDDRVKDIDLLENFNKELDEYKNLLNSVDGNMDQLSGDKKTQVERLYNKLETTVNRDYAKLGALAGADLSILQGIFKPTTGVAGIWNNYMAGGIPSQVYGINDYMGKSKSRAAQQLEVIKQTYPEDVVGDQYQIYNKRVNNMGEGFKKLTEKAPANKPANNVVPQAGKKEKTATEQRAEQKLMELGLL